MWQAFQGWEHFLLLLAYECLCRSLHPKPWNSPTRSNFKVILGTALGISGKTTLKSYVCNLNGVKVARHWFNTQALPMLPHDCCILYSMGWVRSTKFSHCIWKLKSTLHSEWKKRNAVNMGLGYKSLDLSWDFGHYCSAVLSRFAPRL